MCCNKPLISYVKNLIYGGTLGNKLNLRLECTEFSFVYLLSTINISKNNELFVKLNYYLLQLYFKLVHTPLNEHYQNKSKYNTVATLRHKQILQ